MDYHIQSGSLSKFIFYIICVISTIFNKLNIVWSMDLNRFKSSDPKIMLDIVGNSHSLQFFIHSHLKLKP